MSWMTSIVSWLKSLEGYLYDAYLEVLGWVYPFWLLSYPLLYTSRGFGWLAYYFSLFNNWLVWASDELGNILSWDYIKSLIKSWLPRLEAAVSWFLDWWNNVTSVITSWWSATMVTVKGWIQAASDELKSYINNILLVVNSLAAAWDSFKGKIPTIDQVISWWGNWTGNVLSVINTWWVSRLLEVQGLINSAFAARASLWAGWQEMRDQVVAFIEHPFDFLLERFTDWFLGPEV